MINFKVWWKRSWCVHHWHKIDGTDRKVKSLRAPICNNRSDGEKQYYGADIFGSYKIMVKYIQYCCWCDKKKIHASYVMVAGHDKMRVMSYPDIEDSPIALNN